jgi:hypothetical protein
MVRDFHAESEQGENVCGGSSGTGGQGRAPARTGVTRPIKIAKPTIPPIVREKRHRDLQRRIARERVPAVRSAKEHELIPMEDPEVPTEQLHEVIHEHAEHSRETWTLGVALSSALLAGFAAVASLMAGHHANEAMIHQIQSSDQWSYYQSKSIKETELTSKAGILDALGRPAPDADKAKVAAYQHDKENIEKRAEDLEKTGRHHMWTYQKLAGSVTMFQIAISLGAISVLVRRRTFWYTSIVVGFVGIGFLIEAIVTAGPH